ELRPPAAVHEGLPAHARHRTAAGTLRRVRLGLGCARPRAPADPAAAPPAGGVRRTGGPDQPSLTRGDAAEICTALAAAPEALHELVTAHGLVAPDGLPH